MSYTMEGSKIGFAMHGISQYDDELWRLLMGLDEAKAYIGDTDIYNFEGIEFFHLIPIFVMSGAEIGQMKYENNPEEFAGFSVIVDDKDEFIRRFKNNARKYLIPHPTTKQISYIKKLIKKTPEINNSFFDEIVPEIDLNEELSKNEAGMLISVLLSIQEKLEDEENPFENWDSKIDHLLSFYKEDKQIKGEDQQ